MAFYTPRLLCRMLEDAIAVLGVSWIEIKGAHFRGAANSTKILVPLRASCRLISVICMAESQVFVAPISGGIG
jgi:hypothetical protein